MRNFLQSIRNNTPPNCSEDLGVRVQAVVSMAEAAYAAEVPRAVRREEAEAVDVAWS